MLTRTASKFQVLRNGKRRSDYTLGNSYSLTESAEEPKNSVMCRTLIFSDSEIVGAEEGTRTPTPLRVHGPEPCASANSATSARSVSRDT
jgi:hypothetical protein